MMRILLISLVCLLTANSLAQVDMIWSEELKNKGLLPSIFPIGAAGNQYYIKYKKKKQEVILRYSSNPFKIEEMAGSVMTYKEEELTYIASATVNDKLMVVTSFYNSLTKNSYVFSQVIDPTTLIMPDPVILFKSAPNQKVALNSQVGRPDQLPHIQRGVMNNFGVRTNVSADGELCFVRIGCSTGKIDGLIETGGVESISGFLLAENNEIGDIVQFRLPSYDVTPVEELLTNEGNLFILVSDKRENAKGESLLYSLDCFSGELDSVYLSAIHEKFFHPKITSDGENGVLLTGMNYGDFKSINLIQSHIDASLHEVSQTTEIISKEFLNPDESGSEEASVQGYQISDVQMNSKGESFVLIDQLAPAQSGLNAHYFHCNASFVFRLGTDGKAIEKHAIGRDYTHYAAYMALGITRMEIANDEIHLFYTDQEKNSLNSNSEKYVLPAEGMHVKFSGDEDYSKEKIFDCGDKRYWVSSVSKISGSENKIFVFIQGTKVAKLGVYTAN